MPTHDVPRMTDDAPILELHRATVVRHGKRVLDGMDLVLNTGQHTAVLGPNGSGKSTLIRLMTCQIYPLAGGGGAPPIRVFGRERWNVSDLRARMGLISADVHQRFVGGSSLGHVTGIEAVIAGFFASEVLFLHHQVSPGMRERAAAALRRAGAGALADRPVHRMSTGEVRRVLIARALVHEPDVLVLDEPTAGLDLVARHDFLRQMSAFARQGTTVVLVTHHLEEIIPEIDRVVLLSEGAVAADGSPADVLTSETLSRAYGAPVTVRERDGRYALDLRAGAGTGGLTR